MLFEMFLEQNSNKTCGEVFGISYSANDSKYNDILISEIQIINEHSYFKLKSEKCELYYCLYVFENCKFVGFHDTKNQSILDYIKFEDLL